MWTLPTTRTFFCNLCFFVQIQHQIGQCTTLLVLFFLNNLSSEKCIQNIIWQITIKTAVKIFNFITHKGVIGFKQCIHHTYIFDFRNTYTPFHYPNGSELHIGQLEYYRNSPETYLQNE